MTNTRFVDCGCCGRIHPDIGGLDCRAFRTCEGCGDAYPAGSILETRHRKVCDGSPVLDYDDERDYEEGETLGMDEGERG